MSMNGETQIETQPKIQKPNKNEVHEHERSDPSYSAIREWLQEFKENLVDGSVPEPHVTQTRALLMNPL